MKIFSYGSNMNINRLKQRVPSARKISNAYLPGYSFSFNKKSNDGSGKGNIQLSDNLEDKVWGVVFEINEAEKLHLDIVEGLGYGYNEAIINVFDEKGNSIQAQVYIANTDFINNELLPYDWYKAFVVTGAEQNNLPGEYTRNIKNMAFTIDVNVERKSAQNAILNGTS